MKAALSRHACIPLRGRIHALRAEPALPSAGALLSRRRALLSPFFSQPYSLPR